MHQNQVPPLSPLPQQLPHLHSHTTAVPWDAGRAADNCSWSHRAGEGNQTSLTQLRSLHQALRRYTSVTQTCFPNSITPHMHALLIYSASKLSSAAIPLFQPVSWCEHEPALKKHLRLQQALKYTHNNPDVLITKHGSWGWESTEPFKNGFLVYSNEKVTWNMAFLKWHYRYGVLSKQRLNEDK